MLKDMSKKERHKQRNERGKRIQQTIQCDGAKGSEVAQSYPTLRPHGL